MFRPKVGQKLHLKKETKGQLFWNKMQLQSPAEHLWNCNHDNTHEGEEPQTDAQLLLQRQNLDVNSEHKTITRLLRE